MLKKIIVASAMLTLIACSSDDDNSNKPSSSPSQGSSSSSSEVLETVEISKLGINGGISILFNTYPYGYTLRDNKNEDLTPFWNCSPEESNTITANEAAACRLDNTNAMLKNQLTTRSSYLHYIISNMGTEDPLIKAIKLDRYNLTKPGDQAALGLNVSDDDKSIEQKGIDALNGIIAFTYKYKGGAHKFRVAVSDADFWYADVPAQEGEGEIRINVSDLKGMGSFAANEDKDETPFEIGKATKFLWVVEYDASTPANNTGSLLVFLFNALKK